MLATLDHGDTVLVPGSYPIRHLWRRYRRGAGTFGSRGRGGFLQRAGRAIYSRYEDRK